MGRPVTLTQSGIGSTSWVGMNPNVTPFDLTVQVTVTGTVNYTVEYTTDDLNYLPNSTYAYVLDSVTPSVFPDGTIASKTASAVANQTAPVMGARVTINSGNGSVKATFLQAGIAGP